MESEKPKISQEFESMIRSRAIDGKYIVNVNGIKIEVFPYVFPPQSPFSESSHTIFDQFGNLSGKRVLDIGTGTGIQAIQAIIAGAERVDATDINQEAVKCAEHNVKLNGLESRINVWQSDLFDNIPNKRYNLIIANLPIVEAKEEDTKLHSLYDPGFIYHERLFRESPDYLSESGKINLSHANLQREGFERLESLARKNGFIHNIKQIVNSLGYEWRNYEFSIGGTK